MCKAMEDMRNEAYMEGHEEGHAEGLAEGRAEERRSMIIQMLRVGTYNLKDIAGLFGVSVEELEELKQNISR